MKTYKLCLRKGVKFYLYNDNEPYENYMDIWTSIKTDKNNVHYIKHLAKNQMAKRMALDLFHDIKVWPKININFVLGDIELWLGDKKLA